MIGPITTGAPLRLVIQPFVVDPRLLPNNANKLHGRTTGGLRRRQRADVARVLSAQVNCLGRWDPPWFPAGTRVACRATVGWEREVTQGQTQVRRWRQEADGDNLNSALKAARDALQDARIVENDRWLEVLPPVQEHDPDEQGYLIFEVWAIDEGAEATRWAS